MKKIFQILFSLSTLSAWSQNVSVIENLPSVNGTVNAIVRDSNTIYVGGNFSSVSGFYDSRGAALNLNDGQPNTIFPKVNGTINSCIADGEGGWYIGGNFTKVGDYDRINLAQITKDGIVTDFFKSRQLNGSVNTMVAQGNLFVGGNFTSIGPYSGGCAFFDIATGNIIPNFPLVNGIVYKCILDGAGGYFIGGSFTKVGNYTRNNIARINADGTVNAWNPDANNAVMAMAFNGSTLYVAGRFSVVGGQQRSGIAALSTTTGTATSFKASIIEINSYILFILLIPLFSSWIKIIKLDGNMLD